MSISYRRQLHIRSAATETLRRIFSEAAHFGHSHAYMLERRAACFERLRVNQCPQAIRAYLTGIWDQLQLDAYRDQLVYGGFVDGAFYSTHSNRDDYYGKHGMSAKDWHDKSGDMTRGHYWINTHKEQPQLF
jgi:hypothetical protein